jgi:hypothetical protein
LRLPIARSRLLIMSSPTFDFSHHTPEKRIQLVEELWHSLESSAVPLTLGLAAEPRRHREEYRPRRSSGAARAGTARRYRTAGDVTPRLLLRAAVRRSCERPLRHPRLGTPAGCSSSAGRPPTNAEQPDLRLVQAFLEAAGQRKFSRVQALQPSRTPDSHASHSVQCRHESRRFHCRSAGGVRLDPR